MIKKMKDNVFITLIIVAYLAMFLFNFRMGVKSIENSSYYLKEMIMIMPVIFVLTALLDMWIPKEKITSLLGEKSKWKGITLSFLLGSVSAGPIYAAFPFCTMLLKKGASIRNIIIILSSWAVIKIPMLINEVKFLGMKFMIIRWVLTVLSIVVIATILGIRLKKEDIPLESERKVHVERAACIGCGICAREYPEMFKMNKKKAEIMLETSIDEQRLRATIKACPMNAIIKKM